MAMEQINQRVMQSKAKPIKKQVLSPMRSTLWHQSVGGAAAAVLSNIHFVNARANVSPIMCSGLKIINMAENKMV